MNLAAWRAPVLHAPVQLEEIGGRPVPPSRRLAAPFTSGQTSSRLQGVSGVSRRQFPRALSRLFSSSLARGREVFVQGSKHSTAMELFWSPPNSNGPTAAPSPLGTGPRPKSSTSLKSSTTASEDISSPAAFHQHFSKPTPLTETRSFLCPFYRRRPTHFEW
jgi:hypothetical protein